MLNQQNEEKSILMSESLIGELDLESNQIEALHTTKIIVIEFISNFVNDVIIGQLRSIGFDKETQILTCELNAALDSCFNFFELYRQGYITLHGIKLHKGESVISILKTSNTPYELKKCNLYDVDASEGCTIVLAIKP